MKKLILISALAIASSGAAHAQYYGTGSNNRNHYVQPHSKSSGSYSQGHYQTNPNRTQTDNYGAQGNYNPYTGQQGSRPASR